jgi:N-acetylmuramoyl-L-alanine amidase
MVCRRRDMKFMIDPGHGGHDSGAMGPSRTRESDVALAVSLMIAGHFSSDSSHEIMLTRYADVFVELGDRCSIANDWGADAFISIHCNAADSAAASGFEVWTSPGWTPADPIATSIWQTLRGTFPDMRARLDVSDGDPDKESRFQVLVGTEMPAVLVELGFISNPDEEKRLTWPPFQLAAAKVIADVLWGVSNG